MTEREAFIAALQKNDPVKRRVFLELFILVCQADRHAHQKAIIHRDIKSFELHRLRAEAGEKLASRKSDSPLPHGAARARQCRERSRALGVSRANARGSD